MNRAADVWFALPGRSLIEITGPDRAKFLHNLCTQNIQQLVAGEGAEALLLDARVHVLAAVTVFCRSESLVVDTVAGSEQRVLAHLERYHIREKIELYDRSQTWFAGVLCGPGAAARWQELTGDELPTRHLAHRRSIINDAEVWAHCVDWLGAPGWLFVGASAVMDRTARTLLESGALVGSSAAFDYARIAAGTPLYGVDISDKNLPQELDRDARLISFNKGCYLGQETVARIDALGHVNRVLRRLRFADVASPASLPTTGDDIQLDGQTVGHITSAAWDSTGEPIVALGYLRRGSDAPGTVVSCGDIRGEVY